MNIEKVIEKLNEMDKICNESDSCAEWDCKVKKLCDKYCGKLATMPKGMIAFIQNDLQGLENEEI